ncbi:MAG: D-alanine--D-alanine ligase [Spirochaetaceae bacterium]|jgi:D-alanine-D-alanine ligase|nr:D-alanine--D-alanine ligase [Spirochaetaceae bacterium]
MQKLKVGIICGGKSAEHEVSLQSAKNIYEAIDKEKFIPLLIGIEKNGRWIFGPQDRIGDFILDSEDPAKIHLASGTCDVVLPPKSEGNLLMYRSRRVLESPPERKEPEAVHIDVFFPILHGPFGEDGTVQGLLKLAEVPFVGPGVLGSAAGMDKDVMKRLLRDSGIPIGKFMVLRNWEPPPSFAEVSEKLGTPVFVKPCNMGSSVGINKVHDEESFRRALKTAFVYDTKLILEEHIRGREIECSVLGNEAPRVSLPGEVRAHRDFYSYEAKYIDAAGAALEIPAKLSPEQIRTIQTLAVKTFRILECQGLSRVDFFLMEDGAVLVNEINTLPGFTKISMYPKLWETSGISYTELITTLIELALARFETEKNLKTSYS